MARATKSTAAAATGMEAAGLRMKKIGSSMQSFGRSWTTHVSLPIAAVGALAVKSAVEFNKSMTLISTQAGASRNEMERLSKSILKFAQSGKSAFDPQELSKAAFHIESVGFRGAKAMKELRGATKLAAVGGSELEETTYALISAQKTGIKGTQNLGQAMGTLNAIVGHGDIRMEELTQSFSSGILVTAKQLGLSLTDVGAALDVMTSRGVKAQNATTALNQGLLRMATPTSTAAKVLATIGISSEKMAKVMRAEGLPAAVGVLADKLSTLGKTKANQVLTEAFSVKSSKAIRTLVDNVGELHTKVGEITKSTGDFGKKWKETQETPAFKMHADLAQLKAVMIELGEKLLPVVIPLLTEIGAGIRSVIGAFNKLPKWTQSWIIKLGIAAIAFGPIIGALGTIIKMAGTAATALGGLGAAGAATGGAEAGGAVAGVGASALIPPVGVTAAAIVAQKLGEKHSGFLKELQQKLNPDIGGEISALFGESGESAAEKFAKHFGSKVGPEIDLALKAKRLGKFPELSGQIQHMMKIGLESGASSSTLAPLRAQMKRMGDLVAQGMEGVWKRAGGITDAGISKLIVKFAGLTKGVREQSINATLGMMKAWADGHPKIEAQVQKLTEHLLNRFGATNQQLREGVQKGATGPIAKAFQEAAHGVGGALESIGTNTSQMLKLLGLRNIAQFKALVRFQAGEFGPKFTPQGQAKEEGAKHAGHRARGGSVTRPMVMVGEEAPAHPEMVIASNPAYRRKNIGHWMEAGRWLGIPGFVKGGAASLSGSGAGLAGKIGGTALTRVLEGVKHLIGSQKAPGGVSGAAFRHGRFTFPLPAGSWVPGAVDQGWDLAAPGGTPLLALGSGTMLGHGISGFGPSAPIIGLGGGVKAYYGHAGPGHLLPVGTHFRAGQQIGEVGSGIVGISTGPHLEIGFYPPGPMGSGAAMKSALGYRFGGILGRFAKGGLVSGKVSTFGPPGEGAGTTASGVSSSLPGIAIYNQSTLGDWFKVKIGTHSALLKQTDIGPAPWTGRVIDVTGAGARKMGINPAAFPTDSYGTALDLGASLAGAKSGIGTAGARSGGSKHSKFTPHIGIAKATIAAQIANNKALTVGGLAPSALLPSAAGLPGAIQAALSAPGLSYEGKVAIAERAAEVAAGTEGTVDDKAARAFQRELFTGHKAQLAQRIASLNAKLRKGGLTEKARNKILAKREELAGELWGTEGSLQGLQEAEEEETKKAIEEQKAAAEEQTQAIKALTEAIEQSNKIGESEMAVGLVTAKRALADLIAGQLGAKTIHRSALAGNGSVGTL
jgi:TP901 family phage tail tape measure protein